MDIGRRVNGRRLQCGCVFRLWRGMVAHDQDSIGNPPLPPCIVVGILDHDCTGQSEQGLGFALAMKVGVIPVQSWGLIIRYGDLVGAPARASRRWLALGNEIRGDDIVARRSTRTAWHWPNPQPMEMQVGVASGLMIGAGSNIEISWHAGNVGKIGSVTGGSHLSQNRRVVDAVEQPHPEDLTRTYSNRRRNAGPIAVAEIDETEPAAILTDFEVDRLNPASDARHLRRIFTGRWCGAAPR